MKNYNSKNQKLIGIFIFCITISFSVFSQGVGIDISTPNTKLDINGDVALRISSYTAATSNNNISIGSSSFVRLSGPSSAFNLSGIAGGVNGKVIIVFNSSVFDLTILHESGSSTAANRILSVDNTNQIIKRNGCLTLIYSSTDSRWIVISITK